jgi:hypothetical protein
VHLNPSGVSDGNRIKRADRRQTCGQAGKQGSRTGRQQSGSEVGLQESRIQYADRMGGL